MRSKLSVIRTLAIGTVAATTLLSPAYADMPAKPDAQMHAVLDAQKSLGLKPIPTLSVSEAHKQPTVGDGAKKVLPAQHKSTKPADRRLLAWWRLGDRQPGCV